MSGNRAFLEAAGVTHIINATDREAVHFPSEFEYSRFGLEDTWDTGDARKLEVSNM